jgi:hypothetical protein
MNIRPVGAELFHADRHTNGQTDMTKPTVAFRNFANAPKDNTTDTSQEYCSIKSPESMNVELITV